MRCNGTVQRAGFREPQNGTGTPRAVVDTPEIEGRSFARLLHWQFLDYIGKCVEPFDEFRLDLEFRAADLHFYFLRCEHRSKNLAIDVQEYPFGYDTVRAIIPIELTPMVSRYLERLPIDHQIGLVVFKECPVLAVVLKNDKEKIAFLCVIGRQVAIETSAHFFERIGHS